MATHPRFSAVILAAGAICAGVVLSEAGFRVAKRVICATAGTKLFQPHPLYGWIHESDAGGWTYGCVGRTFEWRAFSHMNSNGLRDHDYPFARRPGAARILLLGDSFVEGMQVPLEKTFAKLLEAKLAENGRHVEVINAGVSGFATDNELLFFTTEGDRYEPDVVLLGFTPSNDVMENSKRLYARMYADTPDGPPPKSHFKLRRDGRLRLDTRAARLHWEEFEAKRATFSGRIWLALERNLHIVRLAEAALWRPRPRHGAARVARSTVLGVYAVEPSLEWHDAWAITRALLRRIATEVGRQRATFAAVIVPSKEVVSNAAWHSLLQLWPDPERRTLDVGQPTRRATAMFAQNRIPHLDLLPALRSHLQGTGRTGYFGWDVHLTEEGHEVVAEALLPFVERVLIEHEHSLEDAVRPTR